MTGSKLAAEVTPKQLEQAMRARSTPSAEEIRAEAVYRVDREHAGCGVNQTALNDEYDREELHVASLARQLPWEQVVSKPPGGYRASLRRRREARGRAPADGVVMPEWNQLRDFSHLSAREHEEMRQNDPSGEHDAWEDREAERAQAEEERYGEATPDPDAVDPGPDEWTVPSACG